MKKSFLKLLSATLLLFGTTSIFVACSDDDDMNEMDQIITVDDLPSAAKTFLNTYFNGVEVNKVEKEYDEEIYVYDVNLSNGFEVVFNSEGEWQQVSAPDNTNMTVPDGIIPAPIKATLDEQYHGYGVIEINTQGQYYHVVLSNNQMGPGIDLTFNMSGEIVGMGDMD